ncbi:site-specific integrase [Mesorhizobium sp. M6A.T.Ce.TU.002.03.1.1]|uniref:tyrosine-type recombinase/integrase n=1 Tax=Mesorhizobium sp. M6A.T.Ce.TU.002.03.1.1 TaxID=2496782 RepID=UPI000FCBE5A2|nr:tyrosine-type recombinase/integrase [Mesorhizobium sp. M6A.T.Ce.TU.002.03.1.1]RUU45007.1 site-specific integrase [Mesorhizobium sp. M6A.T.Ce.TU.002.03.1.1]
MATIRKRELPSGKIVWQADYRDGGGKRRHKQFATKKAADDFLLTARGQVRSGTHVADSASITVDKASKLWLAQAEKNGRERATVARYKSTYELYIKPKFGATKLAALTSPAIQTFIDDLTGTMSASSLAKVHGALTSIYKHAVSRGHAAINPARDIQMPSATRDKKRPEMPTKDELRAILKHTPARWIPFVRTAMLTGMRASELRGIQWRDVDLDAGIVHVRRRVDRYNKFGPPKSDAGTRDIPISDSTVTMLKAWRKECPKGEHDLVFPNGEGNVEGHANLLHRMFWPVQIKAGVTVETEEKDEDGKPIVDAKYSLHALRHAAAALFIEQGFPPKKVQDLMGHASLAMTYDVYGYLFKSEDYDRAKIAEMETALLG